MTALEIPYEICCECGEGVPLEDLSAHKCEDSLE